MITAACSSAPEQPAVRARNLLLITIDTLRADRVGAYGYARARTPNLDRLARGARFDRAYAAAPITLPSHATILTGRYPPGHGARDNGLRVSADVPTLATELRARGFQTAAFVAAFPLDRQFGLDRGFDVYRDQLPRGRDGRQANERPAADVVTEAIAWLRMPGPKGPGLPSPAPPALPAPPAFFLWLHLFEPHAPYEGDPARPLADRYDDEVATVDREIGRLLNALGDRLADTIVVAAGDHGEAFGEHGEYAHSIFVYDTTLRVPLIFSLPAALSGRQPAQPASRAVSEPVTLADVAPTVAKLLGAEMKDVDGIDLSPAFGGGRLPARELYAESLAPLLQFGWSPLRSIRSEQWKYIAAPKPELFDVGADPGELSNLAAARDSIARRLDQRVSRYSDAEPPPMFLGARAEQDRGAAAPGVNKDAAERLGALGYIGTGNARDSGARADTGARGFSRAARPDPKDRRDVAALIAQVTSGELAGARLTSALEGILRADPGNSQARLRLGYAHLAQNDCAGAEREFTAAITGGLPSADAHLGLATCLGRRNDLAGAERALAEARRREPANPVVTANLGILQAARGNDAAAIQTLGSALASDPDLHEARFNLALAYARLGRRSEAKSAAEELLRRLPTSAPQRAEVQRLLQTLQ